MLSIATTIFFVLLGSAIFSGLEAAIFSVPLSRAKALLEQGRKGARTLTAIKENMRRPITVVVILNNIFNIGGSMLVGVVTTQSVGSAWIGLVSAVLIFLVIIFAEILPKSVAENHAEPIALFTAKPLMFITRLFSPVVWFIEKITKPFTRKQKIVSEEEIRFLSQLGHLEGAIEEDERDMIQRVFRLNDRTAKDIMTPRTALAALESNKTLREVEDWLYKVQHSRLPVYSGGLDNIVGICLLKELLAALAQDQKDRRVEEFVHEPIVVREDTRVDKLLPFFQKHRTHLAIVTDGFGGTSGVVSLEDVLEELVGEIVDETDKVTDKRASVAQQ